MPTTTAAPTSRLAPPPPARPAAPAGPVAAAPAPAGRRHALGFWAVAYAFLVVLAFTTVTTPLWSLYQERDGLSSLVVTVVFAAYAIGVAASLFLVGHLSDWHGRRRLLVPALVLNLVAAGIFLAWPELPGLLLARMLSGFGIGAATATATAWLVELDAARRPGAPPRRAQAVATAVNLGGFGTGALVSGVLAQWVAHPLVVPFAVAAIAMAIALVLVLATPETRERPVPRPAYRPQRVAVPAAARGRFLAAAAATFIAFATQGLFSSLAPSFLAGTLHHPSHALAGAVAFAVFGSGALVQLATIACAPRALLAAGVPVLLAGLATLVVAVWLPSPSLALFVAGGVVAGAGAGLVFKGAIGTVAALATPDRRAEALAGVFLAGYIGLAVPVIGLGLLTQLVAARVALLVFGGALATGVALATPTLLGRGGAAGSAAGA